MTVGNLHFFDARVLLFILENTCRQIAIFIKRLYKALVDTTSVHRWQLISKTCLLRITSTTSIQHLCIRGILKSPRY